PRADLIVLGLRNAGSTSAASTAKTTTVLASATATAKAAAEAQQNALNGPNRPVPTPSPALAIDHNAILTAVNLNGGTAGSGSRFGSARVIGTDVAEHGT